MGLLANGLGWVGTGLFSPGSHPLPQSHPTPVCPQIAPPLLRPPDPATVPPPAAPVPHPPPPNPAAAPPPCTPPATAPSIPAAGPDLDDAAGPDLEDAAGPVLIDYLHLFCYPSQGKTRFVGALVLIGLGQFLVGGFGDGTRGCSWISSLCFTCRSVSSHLVSSDQALALVLSLLLVLRKTKDPMASRYESDASLTDLLSSLL